MRPLALFQPTGDLLADALLADPGTWLPQDSRPAGPGAWNVPLHVGPLTRSARVEIGDGIRRPAGTWRSVRWAPVSEAGDPVPIERLLPRFTGELGLAQSDLGSSLVLKGDYEVPLGVIGEAIDTLALHRAARATGTTLLGEIATRLRAAEVRGGRDAAR